jgi:hypothetical protein
VPTPGAGSKNRLYLGSAAMAFASTLAILSQSQNSQVRKPLASQVPDGGGVGEVASLLRSQSDARSAGGEKDGPPHGPPPKRESPDVNAEEKESGRNEPSEENQDEPGGAQDSYAVSTVQPSTATATATATAGASQATVITDSPPEPTVPPSEPPEAETAPPRPRPLPRSPQREDPAQARRAGGSW